MWYLILRSHTHTYRCVYNCEQFQFLQYVFLEWLAKLRYCGTWNGLKEKTSGYVNN